MSTPTTATPAFPADSICVLVAQGTTNILGGQHFQTYSPDGAKKGATKLENIHRANNVKLASLLSRDAASLTDDEKAFLAEYGATPKPEALEIRIIESLSFSKVFVPRAVVAAKEPLTAAKKAEELAKLKAKLAAMESAEVVG